MEEKLTRNGGFILLVEDDRGTSELEAQHLAPLGLNIHSAYTPAETIDALKAAQPELMVLDYSFPGMTALELISRLRDESIPVPPFIVVTGRGDEAVAVNSMKAGALDYIVKDSAFLENLLPTTQKALEKAELQAKLKQAETEQRKNLRLYNFLAQINAAAAREKDKTRLFKRICDIAVDAGRFRIAWIGLPDKDTGRIFPACSAGAAGTYLDSIKIILKEGPFSLGPTAKAIENGHCHVIPDMATDPLAAPWREKALAHGFHSSAAIPLKEGGRPVATLNLYSAEADFFTGDERQLLTEIEGDISLALDAISAEEKRAASQAALERTASQLAHVMEVTPVVIFTKRRKNGKLIAEWVSGNAQAVIGYDPSEILAPGWLEKNLHPLDKDWTLAFLNNLPEKGVASHDFRFKKKDGSYFWVHNQLKISAQDSAEITASWTDITPLKESELHFQELFEKAPVGYQSLDAKGNLLAINETWARTFGYTQEEVLGRNFSEFLVPEQKKLFLEKLPDFISTGQMAGKKFDIICKDRSRRRLSFSGRIVYNRDGSVQKTHCVFTDITDTWKNREQMNLLSQVVRASFNEVYIFDPDTFRFIFANYGAVKNLGYAPEELENMTPWDLKTSYTEASFRALVQPLKDGRLGSLVFESVHTRKAGTTYPVEVRLQIVTTGERHVVLAIVNDITEKKKGEAMLAEMTNMQRMESLGQLAGGIAHDFNNMLMGIMANVSFLRNRLGEGENAKIMDETLEAAKNAQGLTANLLAFSKGGKPVKREFCLERALGDIFRLATAGTNADCNMLVPEDLWSVEGDENQIKQCVNNLLLNAVQAMPSGGKLRLEAGNIPREQRPPEPLPAGDYIKVTVSDTGIGIPEKYLPRIFDPYYTTKLKGHGLGLSMAWSVIKNHGGHITVSSVPGKGTTFEVYLPSTGRCIMALSEEKKPVTKGSGSVLVLEDEEIVSNALRRMLAELGYTCEILIDGTEAVRRYKEADEQGKPFAAVIMDLTIPGGKGGKWAVQELRKDYPAAKVIVSSGYSDDAGMADYKKNGFDAVLPKPYKYEDLAETLTNLLK